MLSRIELFLDDAYAVSVPIKARKRESWRDVSEWEGLYQVSDRGRVKSLARTTRGPKRNKRVREKILPGSADDHGYIVASFRCNDRYERYLTHRLVLLTFKGDPPEGKPHGLHKDGDPGNNKLLNLYWGCQKDNYVDSVRHGMACPPTRWVSVDDATSSEIREAYRSGEFKPSLIKRFNLGRFIIDRICQGLANPRGAAPRTGWLTYEDKQAIYDRRKTGLMLKEIAKEFGTSAPNVSQICSKLKAQEG